MIDYTVTDVHERLATDVQLVDVREPQELADGMIPGAQSIPLGELPDRLTELDLSRPVIAICRSGNRSGKATAVLRDAGFAVTNMAGGMLAWHAAGLPITHSIDHAN